MRWVARGLGFRAKPYFVDGCRFNSPTLVDMNPTFPKQIKILLSIIVESLKPFLTFESTLKIREQKS
jgi:hypothetical protein